MEVFQHWDASASEIDDIFNNITSIPAVIYEELLWVDLGMCFAIFFFKR
jgi:hypothetical protein